jgi:hypothetical protein
MAFSFPEFPQATAIDGQRSWTARFDSYDQRNDDVYYAVTLRDDGHEAQFFVQVGMSWAGDDWTGPDFVERLQQEIQRVAATGKANTSYTGPMV